MALLVPDASVGYAGGMNDSAAPTAFRPGEAARIVNWRIATDTLLEVMGGSRRAHATALDGGAQGYGGAVFTASDGTTFWIVFVGDTCYESTDEGETWTQVATGLREAYWSTCTITAGGVNYLIAANGDKPFSYDGTTWSELTNWPSGILYVETYNRRLWGTDGELLIGSKVDDPTVVAAPDGLTLPVVTHDAQRITGLRALGHVLLVGKRDSVAWVDGFGNSDIIVASGARGLSRNVGVLAHRAFIVAGETAYWLSERGIERYRWGGQIELASERLLTTFAAVAWDQIVADGGIPVAAAYPGTREVWFALPMGGSRNNVILVLNETTGGITLRQHLPAMGGTLLLDDEGYLDLADGGQQARVFDDYLDLAAPGLGGLFVGLDSDGYLEFEQADYDPAVLFTADRLARSNAPVSVGYDGFVRYEDEGERFDLASDGSGGETLRAVMVDRPRLYGAPNRKKRGRVVEVLAVAPTQATVSITLRGDGRDGKTFERTVPASSGGQAEKVRVRPDVRGNALQPVIRATTPGLKLAGVSVEAEVLRGLAA